MSYYRYLFYDVNPGEGFNLRRDVYMRVAALVRKLNEAMKGKGKYILVSIKIFKKNPCCTYAEREAVLGNSNLITFQVLPPWGRLYHWQSRELLGAQTQIQWERFFDVDSLAKYAPVMDMDEYLGEKHNHTIHEY